MFVNCKHCNALVATDPVTDLPPERCPRCAGVLRLPQAAPATSAPDVDAPVPDAPAAVQEPPAQAVASPAPETATGDQEPSVEAAPAAALPDAPATAADAASATPDPAPVPMPVDSVPTDDAAPPEPAIPTDKSGDAASSTDASAETAVVANPASDDDVAEAPAQSPADTPAADTPAVAAPPPTEPATTSAETAATAGPGFLSRTAPAASTPLGARRWLLPAAIASLALLLGLQVLLADRDRLAADAQWRPLVVSVCGLFGCSIPAWHEPAAFALLTREVRPHPDAPGALRVSATFRNDARWTQDWPRLVLTLSDVDGRPVAARAFGANEYLASAVAATGLDPGQTADIALDIREPSAATVSYAFDFR